VRWWRAHAAQHAEHPQHGHGRRNAEHAQHRQRDADGIRADAVIDD
jgi:hypothetical protein